LTTVTYDRDLGVYSSLVEDAYYNSETGDLFLEMGNDVYRYVDVPVSVANELANAESAGRYYNSYIKGQFSSDNLGYWGDLNYVDLNEEDEDEYEEEEEDSPILTANEVRTKVFSLTPIDTVNAVAGAIRKHTVVFTAGFASAVKTYDVHVASVDDAIAEIQKIADMLGVKVTVRQVVVNFV